MSKYNETLQSFKKLCEENNIQLSEHTKGKKSEDNMSEYVKKDELSEYARKSDLSEFSENLKKEFEEKISKKEQELQEKEAKFSEKVDAFIAKLEETNGGNE